MLPASHLSVRPGPGIAFPDYLGEHDLPWLRALLDVHRQFEGRPWRELHDRLREPLSPDGARDGRLRAAHVLARRCRVTPRSPVRPAALREALFVSAAARAGEPVERIRAHVAAGMDLGAHDLDRLLFSDVPSERLVGPVPDTLGPTTLRLEVNAALVKGLLARAHKVEIGLRGNARAVVRQAQLRGLLCAVERASQAELDVVISVSGPLALFRRTLLYGRALASLVPVLSWCDRFSVRAACQLEDKLVPVELASGDPIFPGGEPRRFDSRLEQRFERDFGRLSPDWDIVREPEPVATGRKLLFPDFALVHRRDRTRRWLLEIVGFWTESYLADKLASLREAALERLILCIDADRRCDSADLPPAAHVVPFRRRIDPAAVLAVLDP